MGLDALSKRTPVNRTAFLATVIVGLVGAVGLAGCGGGGGGSSSSAGGTTSGAAPGGDPAKVVAEADKAVAVGYAGTDRPLPTSGPKAQKGKNVWVISCSQAAAGCAIPAEGAVEAGEKIGWNMTLADGKGDPTVYNKVIREAAAAGADGVILVIVDCGFAEGALKAAQQAGVKIYSLYSADCDDEYVGQGKPLPFDGELSYGKIGNYEEFAENQFGPAAADYAIAKTDGKAKVILMRLQGTASVYHINAGFERELSKCTECELFEKTYTIEDLLSNKVQGMTAAELTQHPEANVVMATYDAAILLGIGEAAEQVRAEGRELMVLGGEGLPPNIELIEKGTQTMAVGAPGRWAGWAAIDGLNRVFAGQPQVDPGIGYQLMDASHNLPSGPRGYDGNPKSKDYAANYLRIWGVEGQ